jgi:hypothetical protein
MRALRAIVFALVSAIILEGIAGAASVTNPEIRGPLPDTATKGVLVWNLSEANYVAEEYLVSGKADVYEAVAMADAGNMLTRNNVNDMAQRDFALKTVKAGQPYTTRILVYRPADPKRFSGNVIVETLHPSGGGRSVVWDMLNSYFIGHGDAYIGVQHPSTFAGLKTASPGRYDDLSMVDNTQLWSSIAQVGKIVKGAMSQSPLKGYAVKRLYLTGYSFTGVATTTFANWHHASAVLENGRPIFDGYVSNANSMYNRPIDAPVMRMNTQSDFDSFGGIDNRRDDSDAKNGGYRLYEVSGAAHVTRPVPPAPGAKRPQPPPGGVASANQPRFSPEACTNAFPIGSQANTFPLHLMVAAMFENMYRWVDNGTAPPRAPRIETNSDGSTRKDADGNAKGGLRMPLLVAPIATYDVGHGDDCFLFGYQQPYSADKKKSLYGSQDAYVDAVKRAAERQVKERWLLPSSVDVLTSAAHADNF